MRFSFVFIHENCIIINIALCLPLQLLTTFFELHVVSSAGPEHDSDEMCHIFEGAKEFVF